MRYASLAAEALIRSYYEAFNRRDWPTFMALLVEGVVHDVNQGGREVGKPAFKAFIERMDKAYAEQVVDLVVMVSKDGRRAAAEFTIQGKYLVADQGMPPARGQKYMLPVGAFFELDGAKIARVTNYYNLQDWLKQVT
jgi:steroid delta-isomerase-like uncharacterized protein